MIQLSFHPFVSAWSLIPSLQTMFESVLEAVENGGKRQPITVQLGYTREQAEAIQKLKAARDNYERLGLGPGASK